METPQKIAERALEEWSGSYDPIQTALRALQEIAAMTTEADMFWLDDDPAKQRCE